MPSICSRLHPSSNWRIHIHYLHVYRRLLSIALALFYCFLPLRSLIGLDAGGDLATLLFNLLLFDNNAHFINIGSIDAYIITASGLLVMSRSSSRLSLTSFTCHKNVESQPFYLLILARDLQKPLSNFARPCKCNHSQFLILTM